MTGSPAGGRFSAPSTVTDAPKRNMEVRAHHCTTKSLKRRCLLLKMHPMIHAGTTSGGYIAMTTTAAKSAK